MTTKDSGGGLGVNVRAPNDDLDQEVGRGHVTNVPGVVPHLDLAKARERQGGQDASDHLHVLLGSPGLVVDVGAGESMQVINSESSMVVKQVHEVLERLCQVLRHVQIPTTSGSTMAKKSKKGVQASRVHIEVISRVLIEGFGGLAVDGQASAVRVIDDAGAIPRNQREGNCRSGSIGVSHDAGDETFKLN